MPIPSNTTRNRNPVCFHTFHQYSTYSRVIAWSQWSPGFFAQTLNQTGRTISSELLNTQLSPVNFQYSRRPILSHRRNHVTDFYIIRSISLTIYLPTLLSLLYTLINSPYQLVFVKPISGELPQNRLSNFPCLSSTTRLAQYKSRQTMIFVCVLLGSIIYFHSLSMAICWFDIFPSQTWS